MIKSVFLLFFINIITESAPTQTNVANVFSNRVLGGHFNGKRNIIADGLEVNDDNLIVRLIEPQNPITSINNTLDSPVFVFFKRNLDRILRQSITNNTSVILMPVINGGSFIGKRDSTNRNKRQWQGNYASVYSSVINAGNFIGKRFSKNSKRQVLGNTANVFSSVIAGGNFIGKRSKRQMSGNTVNVYATSINDGNFVGKRQIVNLLTNGIQGATFTRQANIIDSSSNGLYVDCDTTGCVNIMG